MLLEPSALLARLLLLEVDGSHVYLALDLRRMFLTPFLQVHLTGCPCALQCHPLRGGNLEDLCLLGRLQGDLPIRLHGSSAAVVEPPSSAAIRLRQHFLRDCESSPDPFWVGDDSSGPADLLVGLLNTRLPLISDLAPPHGRLFG